MNALKELLSVLDGASIKCATISYGQDYWHPSSHKIYQLGTEYSPMELDSFFRSLDFDYDSGYGGQELFGTVWLMDGTWLERGEYDGSEWWEHRFCPEIPIVLSRKVF